jgi:hypothetical protein
LNRPLGTLKADSERGAVDDDCLGAVSVDVAGSSAGEDCRPSPATAGAATPADPKSVVDPGVSDVEAGVSPAALDGAAAAAICAEENPKVNVPVPEYFPTFGIAGNENGAVICNVGAITALSKRWAEIALMVMPWFFSNMFTVSRTGTGTATPTTDRPLSVIEMPMPATVAPLICMLDDGVTVPSEATFSVAVDLISPIVSGPIVRPWMSDVAVSTTSPSGPGATEAVVLIKAAFPARVSEKPAVADAELVVDELLAVSW